MDGFLKSCKTDSSTAVVRQAIHAWCYPARIAARVSKRAPRCVLSAKLQVMTCLPLPLKHGYARVMTCHDSWQQKLGRRLWRSRFGPVFTLRDLVGPELRGAELMWAMLACEAGLRVTNECSGLWSSGFPCQGHQSVWSSINPMTNSQPHLA